VRGIDKEGKKCVV